MHMSSVSDYNCRLQSGDAIIREWEFLHKAGFNFLETGLGKEQIVTSAT
jgi:hypothetical protein